MTPHTPSSRNTPGSPERSGSAIPAPGEPTDGKLGRVIRVLSANPLVELSGTKIAEELGTSRSEVWRLVEQLRELGVEIAGHQSIGYRLESVPDLLLPEILGPLVSGTIFDRNIHHFFRISSTNVAAMAAAAQGEPEGSVFLAEEQTSGKGRGGHAWASDASAGIYCSAILRPALAPADVLMISLAAGLAVSAAVEQVTGLQPDLRWPNDVLLGDRKFCGVLTELNAEVTRVRYAVVGIGINVNQSRFPDELRELATSLHLETGRPWSRVELTAALLKSLDCEYRALVTDASAARQSVFRRFEQRSSFVRGARVHVEEDGGYDGVTEGLDERGFLRVRTGSGMRTVLSGGVRKP